MALNWTPTPALGEGVSLLEADPVEAEVRPSCGGGWAWWLRVLVPAQGDCPAFAWETDWATAETEAAAKGAAEAVAGRFLAWLEGEQA